MRCLFVDSLKKRGAYYGAYLNIRQDFNRFTLPGKPLVSRAGLTRISSRETRNTASLQKLADNYSHYPLNNG